MDPILEKFRKLITEAYKTIIEDETLLESEPFLVPAIIQRSTGKIFKGAPGQYHHDIAEKNGFFKPGWKETGDFDFGFVNHKGHFLTRARALDYAMKYDLLNDAAKKYIATDGTPAELGASFLKNPNQKEQ